VEFLGNIAETSLARFMLQILMLANVLLLGGIHSRLGREKAAQQ